MSKFSATETMAIEKARKAYPTETQRGLATLIFRSAGGFGEYEALNNRTKSAIYGALRRYDAAQKAAAKTTSTTARRSRRLVTA